MGPIIALNLTVIVLLVIAAACIGNRQYVGAKLACLTFLTTLGLSLLGWIIFVAAHFIVKYW